MTALYFVSVGLIYKNSLTDLNQGWQIIGPSAEGRFLRGEANLAILRKLSFSLKKYLIKVVFGA